MNAIRLRHLLTDGEANKLVRPAPGTHDGSPDNTTGPCQHYPRLIPSFNTIDGYSESLTLQATFDPQVLSILHWIVQRILNDGPFADQHVLGFSPFLERYLL